MNGSTECSLPPPPTDEQLLAVLSDEDDSGVRRHLELCTGCRTRFEQMVKFEQNLQRKLRDWHCPSSEQLRDYIFDLLNAAEKAAVYQHLELCVRCRLELQQLNRFLNNETSSVQSPTPKHPKRPRYNQRYPQVTSAQPAYALRGSHMGEPLMVDFGDVTIFLDLQPNMTDYTLNALLVTSDLQSWVEALTEVEQGRDTYLGIVDETGNFQCRLKTAGVVTMLITSQAGTTLVIENLEFSSE